MSTNNDFLKRLRTPGFIEGVSTLILFGIAMPMKYVGGMPMAVTIAGSVHGLLFVLLASMFLLAISRVPISRRMAMLGIAAAVIPFGPFWMDSRLRRVGGLKVAESQTLAPASGSSHFNQEVPTSVRNNRSQG